MTMRPCYITRMGDDVWTHRTASAARNHAYALAGSSIAPSSANWCGFYGGHVSDWDLYLAHEGPLTIHEERI